MVEKINMKNNELHNIFKGIANKNEDEFNKLYKNYKSLIYAVVFSMLKNREDTEEVVQTVFTKIWNMKISNLPTEKEKTWLYNVAKNTTIDYLRKQKNTLNIDDLYYINKQDEELNKIIEKEYYNKILSKLNIKEQEIVSLKILSNLSFREISEMLNIPIGTVQWKYYKALNTLKMLISNLTMFILTFTLYIKQRSSIKKLISNNEGNIKQNTSEEHEKQNTSEENEKDREDNEVEKTEETNEATKRQDTEIEEQEPIYRVENATEDKNESKNDNITNEIVENSNTIIENNNIIVENTTINQEKENMIRQNNIIFYISSIFLVITIIFLAISIKQYKHKKCRISNNK